MAGKTAGRATRDPLPQYFRKKAQGKTASGHKQGRRWKGKVA